MIAIGRAVMTAPSRGAGEADVGPIGIPPDPRASSGSDEVVVCAGRIGLAFEVMRVCGLPNRAMEEAAARNAWLDLVIIRC